MIALVSGVVCFVGVGLFSARKSLPCVVSGAQDSFDEMQVDEEYDTYNIKVSPNGRRKKIDRNQGVRRGSYGDDNDDSGIHSSCSSDSSNSYQEGDGGASVGGSVSIVGEFGGLSASCGESISVSSGTSSGADSGYTGLMSQDAPIWSGMHSFMTCGVAP